MPDTPSHPSIGMPFIELQTTDSTNNYALTRIHAGMALHGLTIFTHEQTMGRGQRGKKWVSNAGDNIALSMIINPAPLSVADQFQLSACAAVAVHNFFEKLAGTETKIKWPNDIYWKDRKAGGILIESVVGGRGNVWSWSVVGVGLNINQTSFPTELINPVSLKQITGKNHETVRLAKELCNVFNDYFIKLRNEGFDEIYDQYMRHLYKRGETVKLKKDNRVFTAKIKGVSRNGRLIIDHAIEEEVDFGNVEWMSER